MTSTTKETIAELTSAAALGHAKYHKVSLSKTASNEIAELLIDMSDKEFDALIETIEKLNVLLDNIMDSKETS
ncbi:hypothetical protein CMI47_06310 [Candidatus Pacearchaeota archaeon]|nr:hypothetical protein [Candidatus Pacearchaeota archaeon]